MLINRKKDWRNKPHTVENCVDSVAEIHEDVKPEPVNNAPQPSLFMGSMKTCNIGQSPEVQPRDLLNL